MIGSMFWGGGIRRLLRTKRPLLALLSAWLLSAGALACGGSSTAGHAGSSTAAGTSTRASTIEAAESDYRRIDGDRDNDVGAPYDDTNNSAALDFGNPADSSDRRTITALVKRYYAAALAGDAARGCSMIYSPLAEAAGEDYGLAGGPSYSLGAKTCQEVLAKTYAHFHAQLAAEVPKLTVTHVLLKEHHGVALLAFAGLPEREIPVTREGHIWRIAALLDRELE
jgi:hypothetical protein